MSWILHLKVIVPEYTVQCNDLYTDDARKRDISCLLGQSRKKNSSSSFSILFWTESRCLIWQPGAWRSLLSTQPWQLPWLWVLSLLVNNYQVNKRARWHIGNLMSLNLGVLRSAGYHLEFQTIPLLCNTEVSYFLWM